MNKYDCIILCLLSENGVIAHCRPQIIATAHNIIVYVISHWFRYDGDKTREIDIYSISAVGHEAVVLDIFTHNTTPRHLHI